MTAGSSSVPSSTEPVTAPIIDTPLPVQTPLPGTTTPTTPTVPGTSPFTSFVLVNAGTDKDILTVNDGASISIRQIGTTKLNLRVNTSTAIGSAKFELTGAKVHTSFDNALPFALFGDNGKGDYYAGIWNPVTKGTYTLKVTPYSEDKGQGTAGVSRTITFKIID